MKIATERLDIVPLTSTQLELYVKDPLELSRQLHLSINLNSLSEHMKRVYHLKSKRIIEEPASLLYNTYFIIILRERREMIGSLGLKGNPDPDGLVEVGYGIDPEFQNKGYMKEALSAFLCWILKVNEVSGVNACTSSDNIISQRVLQACGFDRVYYSKDLMVWRYSSL